MFDMISTLLQGEHIDKFSAMPIEKCDILYPRKLPENVRYAVIFLMPYYTGDYKERNVSLYAVSRDYHGFIKELSARILPRLKQSFPDEDFYLFADNSPLSEVSCAVKSGLGVIGKNHLLINDTYGSYVFIGSILTSASLLRDDALSATETPCENCNRCINACAYLSGKTAVCHSALTQQKIVTDKELSVIASKTIKWGCDVCQEVCPMNRDVKMSPIPYFHEKTLPVIDESTLLNMTDEEFSARAFAWRKRDVILRNITSHKNGIDNANPK